MTKRHHFSEIGEIIRLAMREQAIHPQGLNSSHTHGTLYPVGDPRNDESTQPENSKPTPIKLMRPRLEWRYK